MRLTELDPEFLRVTESGSFQVVETIDGAMGVSFLCPLCYAKNGDPRGTHSVICWSSDRGTPDAIRPGPGRWTLKGTSFSDLTLDGERGKTRSVQLVGGCGWHGFVTNGEAE
jgi:hypothetical protein